MSRFVLREGNKPENIHIWESEIRELWVSIFKKIPNLIIRLLVD